MKISTPLFKIEIETIFIIIIFVSIFSPNFQKYMISYYLCYLFIFFHELFHMFIASIFGQETECIKFTVSGVCINIKKKKYNGKKISILKNIIIYLSGPVANILLAFIFCNIKMFFEINVFLAMLNLLPIFPLDGYNILKNILLLKKREKMVDISIRYIENLLIVSIFILSILQIIILKNISILIFVFYLIIIKINNKKERHLEKIINKITC